MKIAFTSSGKTWDSLIDPRFGRTEFIALYDEDNKELNFIDNSAVKNDTHGAGTATAQKLFELKPDILITGNGPGETATAALKHVNVKVFIKAHDLTLKQAYDEYVKGSLEEVKV